MSITESKLEKVHIFPSEDSYKNNINSVGENDLALVSIDNILSEIRSDIQNVATRPYVTEEWHQGSNWYRVWSTGFIEQGGITTRSSNTANIQTTLNIAFSDTDYVVIAIANMSSAKSSLIGVYEKTTSSFYSRGIANDGSANNASRMWYACGY